jgi:hypothetical protein
MHDLPFRSCSNKAQLCNASTDQRDTRAVRRAFCQCTQKGQAFNGFGKRICVVDDEDQFTVRCGEIGKECRCTHRRRLVLANSSGESWQADTIILIRGEVEGVTQATACSQPAYWSVGANPPSGDGTTLAVPGATADECEPSVGERIQCSINTRSS